MADGTEVGIVVGAHAAVLLGAPDTLREVATTLDEGGLTSVYQRLPLGRVGGRGGEVGLPRLYIAEIHGVIVAVGGTRRLIRQKSTQRNRPYFYVANQIIGSFLALFNC